jgi:Alkylmercury lyase
MSVTLEVLHVPGCPKVAPMLERLREATDLPVITREITSAADAAAAGMTGSPTLLINGTDPFPMPILQGCDCGVSCRIYRDEHGQAVPAPSATQLRDAVNAAGVTAAPSVASTGSGDASPGLPLAMSEDESCCDPVRPGEVLSTWRTRTLPLDPVEKATHQAILRAFAATGRPPARSDLDPGTAGSGRTAAEVLAALHELDAILLAPDNRIAVAYPFSATPTRHKVRIGDRVEVYAMCAIDALGMSAMLGEETRIDSVDVTTGHPVTVTMTGSASRWDPAGAVVFIGADAAGGPSADCCCDYPNFFTDTTAAQAWIAAHPHVPGQILTQAEAADLGTRLFGHLLATT